MSEGWQSYVRRIEELAARSGLEFYRVDFEAVPDSFMMEIAVYGLPVRMPHWSFGVRYIYQLIQRHMGHSRLFEVVFPGNPGHAYLAESNGLAENILVTAHVLGHADFARNNLLFRRCQEQVSEHIVEHAANHARQIQQAIETHGAQRVEAALDAALALEQHVDIDQPLRRERYPEFLVDPKVLTDDQF
ncbi:MAG: stage V sporulation protein R, partial [Gammaproteobacteria bacterium]